MKTVKAISFLVVFLLVSIHAQDVDLIPLKPQTFSTGIDLRKDIYSPDRVLEIGDILYSIQTNQDNVLGVTVANNLVIISSGGSSSELSNDNMFLVYNFDGTLINSYPQGSTTGFGFRDLAFDGTNILGSEDNTIKKINPVTFQIVGSITNTSNNPHRGLAYDGVDNTIWSTNGSTGPLIQMDASTGNNIRTLANPVSYAKPYGIAFDRFTSSQSPYSWFAEPWSYGSFRISKVDVIDGLIYHTIDLKAALGNPDSCLSGGLEIINNHPNYPDKIIAIAVEQRTNTILFIDITGTPLPETVLLSGGTSIGGWINGALIQNNFAFVFQANNVNAVDLSDDNKKLSFRTFSAEPAKGIIINDYLYFSYINWDNTYKKKIEILDVSNKNSLSKKGSIETSKILDLGVEKLAAAGNYLLILTKESPSVGVNEKILMYNIIGSSLVYKSEHTADIKDITASGNYLYVLLTNGNLTIYDVSNGTFSEKGSLAISNAEKISVYGNYVYTACNNSSGMKIIDVSSPLSPFQAAVFGNNQYSFYDDILITENTAFLKTTNFDIVSVNISNTLSPAEISNFNPSDIGNFKFSGYYSNSLFLNNSGMLNEIDYSNPSAPIVSSGSNEPSMINCNTSIGNTLYSTGSDKLWVYDIGENGEAVFNSSIEIPKANRVYNDGNLLFVCDRDNLLYIYNTSLQLLGTYNAGAPVVDVETMNGLLYLILYNSANIKIVDYSNPSFPVERSTFVLPYTGQAVAISTDGNTLFTASNKTTIGGNTQGYFQSINVSNPANPVLLADKQITGGNKIYNLCVNNNTLFIGGSDNSGWFPLEAWNISDPANPLFIAKTMLSFTSPLSDIAYYNGYIFAALPDAGEIVSYRWDSNAQQFFPGPTITAPEPVEITIFKKSAGTFSSKSYSQILGPPSSYNYAVANNGAKYQQQVEGSKGNKLIKIIAIPKQQDPQFADLTMSVNPAEAADHGCTTSPAPGGPYRYAKGASVNLSATDNPSEGWYFKEWTGATGKANTTIVMDADKNVIANFVEVKLTVSGNAIEDVVCPAEADKNLQNVLPITLCASPASGWAVQGITFKASGTGDESKNLEVFVYRGANLIANGRYSIDDGEVQCFFFPTVIVPANECVTLNLKYDFEYELPTNVAIDTTYTFLVETKHISAAPLEYAEGLIQGKAKRSGPFTVARIYNDWEIGFSTIQQAVNSDYMQDGGTCYLCDGIYAENVLINEKSKKVTITSVNSKESVFIMRKSNDADAIQIKDINNITIQNVTFDGSKEGVGWGVTIYRSNSSKVKGSTFRNFKTGLVAGNGAEYLTAEYNLFDSNDRGIALAGAENNTIRNNTFTNSYSDKPDIDIFKGKNNYIRENTILQPGGRLNIDLWLTSSNRILSNDAFISEGAEKYSNITIKESFSNQLSKNLCYEVYIEESDSNKIEDNELLKVELRDSKLNDIKRNNISGQGRISANGIYMSASEKNYISKNNIYHNEKNGIELPFYSHHVLIAENTIDHNKLNGIDIRQSHGTQLYKNTIYDNDRDGVHISSSGGTDLFENKITGHNKEYEVYGGETDDAAAIQFFDCFSGFVYRNILKENCTAVLLSDSKNINIGQNDVNNNLCFFTGIHLDNSEAEIFGNNIIDNQGNGVFFSNNSGGVVRANNIFGNSEFGVNNSVAASAINASNNWWGNETGPSSSDITGNLNITSWLSAPLSLFCNTSRDTVYVSSGKTDSSFVHFQNYKFPNDVLDISVSDELGWITSLASFSNQMKDSLGTSANIIFNVPADVTDGAINKVSVTAQSSSDANDSVKDSFYIFIYRPALTEMLISPDSVRIAPGDSLQLYAYGEDQYGKTFNINPLWEASLGEISVEGLFRCSEKGTAVITATDSATGIKTTAVVIIDDVVSVEEEKIIPREYTLFQNYPNPFNPTTTIKFGLPAASMVKVEAFNILGERIAQLVNEIKDAGYYQVEWKANGLASGIYFYSIYAKTEGGEEFRAVKKMLLLR